MVGSCYNERSACCLRRRRWRFEWIAITESSTRAVPDANTNTNAYAITYAW
jgi:hypothetical protein